MNGSGLCQPCYPAVTNCLTCNGLTTACTACVNASYYVDSSSQCVSCPTNCDTCLDATLCYTCLADTHFIDGTSLCVLCTTNNVLGAGACTRCNLAGTACLNCVTTHYLNGSDSTCYVCSTLMPQCLQCTSDSFCTLCVSPTHYVHSDGTCQLCSFFLGSYCTQCLSST